MMEEEALWLPFQLGGQAVYISLDTGAFQLGGPLYIAQSLDLPLEDVSDQNLEYVGANFTSTVRYIAKDVSISGFGKEIRDEYIVDPEEQRCKNWIVGMTYLIGSRIEIFEDGTCELSFPEVTRTKYGALIRKRKAEDRIPGSSKEEGSGMAVCQGSKVAKPLQ